MTPAVQTYGLHKRFGGVQAVRGVDLLVEEGEVRGVIGPNGAGKTTLVNLLSGLARPSSGRIVAFGRDVSRMPAFRMARDVGVVRTFQTGRLFDELTVYDNVLVAAAAAQRGAGGRGGGRFRRGPADVRTREALADLGLTDSASAPVGGLPYGTRRKVEIARALAMQPRLVLLDEPAAGLNDKEREELARTLGELASRGVTLILVEHQMDLVAAVCSRLTVLDFGEVLHEGPTMDVIRDERVIEAYLGTALGGGSEAV